MNIVVVTICWLTGWLAFWVNRTAHNSLCECVLHSYSIYKSIITWNSYIFYTLNVTCFNTLIIMIVILLHTLFRWPLCMAVRTRYTSVQKYNELSNRIHTHAHTHRCEILCDDLYAKRFRCDGKKQAINIIISHTLCAFCSAYVIRDCRTTASSNEQTTRKMRRKSISAPKHIIYKCRKAFHSDAVAAWSYSNFSWFPFIWPSLCDALGSTAGLTNEMNDTKFPFSLLSEFIGDDFT